MAASVSLQNFAGVKLRDNMGREVVMMRACQHENIAQLFGVFQELELIGSCLKSQVSMGYLKGHTALTSQNQLRKKTEAMTTMCWSIWRYLEQNTTARGFR